jgi:hypothetical protein
LRGRLTFTPWVNPFSGEVDGYEFEGPTRYAKLFSGLAVEAPPPSPTAVHPCGKRRYCASSN